MFRAASFRRAVARFGAPCGALALAASFAVVRPALAQFADPFAWTTDGRVAALASSGSTLWLGGRFGHMGPALGACTLLDTADATPRIRWPHVDAPVHACLADGAGGWYLGGEFTLVNGVPRAHAAHVRADGTLDGWDPSPDATVDAIAFANGVLYLGGAFANAGGAARAHLAAVDADAGAATAWNPGADGPVFALVTSGPSVVAGGQFLSAGGQARAFVAALDSASGAATAWNPGADNVVFALAASGSTVYMGGFFSTVGGLARFGAAAVDGGGVTTAWDPEPDNDVTALAVSGATVYAGGDFTWIGGASRRSLAALDAATGVASAWNPSPDGAVDAIQPDGPRVWVGGFFAHAGGAARPCIAALDAASGAATAWDPGVPGVLGTGVFALGVAEGGVFAGGLDFLGPGTVARANLAALDLASGQPRAFTTDVTGPAPWVSALALSGGRLYVGGTFTRAAGVARTNLAALDTLTGGPLAWNPGADDRVLALAPSGGVVYAGGRFARIGSFVRVYLAAVDTGTALATTWNPAPDAPVEALALPAAVPQLVAGGAFTLVGFNARAGLAAFTLPSGALASWTPGVGGTSPAVHALAASGAALVVGGHFSTLAGGARSNVGVVALGSGTLSPWNPGADADVRAVGIAGTAVDLGGDFGVAGGAPRRHVARVPSNGGFAATDWNPGADGLVAALAELPAETWLGGSFVSTGRRAECGLAGIHPLDVVAPTAFLTAPVGAVTVNVGGTLGIGLLGSDDFGIQSGDVYLSRTGPSGPWELLAAGVDATWGFGAYAWTVTGPPTTDGRLRIVMRDYQGNTGETVSSDALTIAPAGAGVEPDAPRRVELAAPWPNPCAGAASIAWALPAAGRARLSLLDVQGREVALLADGPQAAGRHVSGIAGERLAPGLYFVRLVTATAELRRRVVVTR